MGPCDNHRRQRNRYTFAYNAPEPPKWLTWSPIGSSLNQIGCSELLAGNALGAEIIIKRYASTNERPPL